MGGGLKSLLGYVLPEAMKKQSLDLLPCCTLTVHLTGTALTGFMWNYLKALLFQ